MFVKLPMWLITLPKLSGRSHATVKAQMPPLLAPAIARIAGSLERFSSASTRGRTSSCRKRA